MPLVASASGVARAIARGTHFAPYPRELVRRCLAVGCRPGGLVLDPFLGGGTTMGVALAMGHPVIGIDLSPEFCAHVGRQMGNVRVRTAFKKAA